MWNLAGRVLYQKPMACEDHNSEQNFGEPILYTRHPLLESCASTHSPLQQNNLKEVSLLYSSHVSLIRSGGPCWSSMKAAHPQSTHLNTAFIYARLKCHSSDILGIVAESLWSADVSVRPRLLKRKHTPAKGGRPTRPNPKT